MTTTVKGRFTFRFAAACFLLSGVFELLNLQDEALLFGHAFGGMTAVIYHVIYAALFAWLMLGLWNGTRQGYYALLITTVIYSADRLQAMVVGDALANFLRQQAVEHPEITQIVNVEDLVRFVTLTTLAMLACWWGFAAYAYYRRDYFGISRGAR